MTNTRSYTFLDLLKDHNYVPKLNESNFILLDNLLDAFNKLTSVFEKNTVEYDFMDLLKDNGYGLEPIFVPANDNVFNHNRAA